MDPIKVLHSEGRTNVKLAFKNLPEANTLAKYLEPSSIFEGASQPKWNTLGLAPRLCLLMLD